MKSRSALILVVFAFAMYNTTAQSPTAQGTCAEQEVWIRQLTNAGEGWSAKPTESGQELSRNHLSIQGKDIIAVQFQPSAHPFEFPELLVSQCDQSATLNKAYLALKRVTAYQRDGRTFAWILYGTIVRSPAAGSAVSGADLNIALSDTHGTGKFDQMRIGAPLTPIIPSWIK